MLARHLSRTSRRGTELVFRIHSFRMKERPSLFQAHLRWCNDSFPFHIKGFWNYENCFHHIGNHFSTQNNLKFFLHEMDVYNKHSHGIFRATWGKQPTPVIHTPELPFRGPFSHTNPSWLPLSKMCQDQIDWFWVGMHGDIDVAHLYPVTLL